MLKRWTLGNFKAIADEITLQLAPITVLAGANSSGKSSILQSILLVAQTLRAKPGEQPILLNGEYVRLGYITDVLHNGATQSPLVFGFEYSPNFLDLAQPAAVELDFLPITALVKLSAERHAHEQMRTRLDKLELAWGSRERLTVAELMDERFNLANPKYADMLMAPELRMELQQGVYGVAVTRSTRSFQRIDPFSLQVALRHFLPARILETYDWVSEKLIAAFQSAIATLQPTNDPAVVVVAKNATAQLKALAADPALDKMVRDAFQRSLATQTRLLQGLDSQASTNWQQEKNRALNLFKHSATTADWVEEVKRSISSVYWRRIAAHLQFTASAIRPRTGGLPSREIGMQSSRLPADLRSGLDLLTDFFSNRIYYIGPLRESPQYIYNLPPYPEITHVGSKGEFTASVLEHFKAQTIDFPLPPNLAKEGKTVERNTLAHALHLWLASMGLLDGVTTTDRGKMGTELTVRAQGVARDLDLTSIGVGVSQVLPTLVTGLIAPRGTTFLLEQPELHLHPKVQSMLGDFLLGLTQVGKQCIVETHSEYLINRLRRRVAEDESDRLAEQIRIYFVEREQGRAAFQAVDLNAYGAVVKWPKGFFDEGPAEAQLLMDAAMKKRRRG